MRNRAGELSYFAGNALDWRSIERSAGRHGRGNWKVFDQVKKQSRVRGLLFCIVCLGGGLGPSWVGHAQVQQPPADALASQLKADFQAVKARAADVQRELPRLDDALEALAARLRERADLSVEEKAARLARLDRARAVLRGHDETLRRLTRIGPAPGAKSIRSPSC
jgi:hypothetical protein